MTKDEERYIEMLKHLADLLHKQKTEAILAECEIRSLRKKLEKAEAVIIKEISAENVDE